MERANEHPAGASAPQTGTYELLNILGSPTGDRIHVEVGEALPPAPFGWNWRLESAPDRPD